MSAGRMRFFPPTSAKKERDEELALFRELFKREREKNMNLLESVSTEFEPVEGNSVVFKISAGKKGDTHGNENEKNDYDWLKTPPATPLFQSLEMDVGQGNNPNMIIHKELPIIPALKPSRFSEKKESKTVSKPPSSPSVASFRSASSSRPDSPDPYTYQLSPPRSITTPIATPRFGSQRFAKESDKEPSAKPLHTGRFLRRKDETLNPRSKSPGSLSVASTATSSRSETAVVNPNAPSIRKADKMIRGKEDSKPVERSINRFSKEGSTKQKPDPKLQTRQIKSVGTKPTPSSRSVTSAISSRPDSPDSKPIKQKGVPKSLEKQVKKTIKDAPAKQNPEFKPNNRTVSPLVRSRFPATHPDFPTEAPPNLITSVAPGRSTSATRSRPGVPAMPSAEERRSPSATKTRRPGIEEEKQNEKRGGNNGAVVIGSSMVERMLNARKSTATGKMAARGEKASKIRGM
ncbi:hypothetical protein KFK09_011295 [Dendrobium nobile]|uniref:Uncharacterized protein n=1 Tax=Dendrobium nobile TaxID=94219 RepID=A0A8T3BCH0_DENNO|nr:hypothetical protein KFK09_011295 [Dendrobium nobile]